jgi:hypothetical protein
VIGKKEYDRIISEAVRFQVLQQLAGLRVHHRQPVVILRPVLADFGRVGVVGRNANLLRIMKLVSRLNRVPQLALVCDGMVEHRKERLAVGALAPVRAVARFVPHLPFRRDVVVLLGVVRAVVAARPQMLRQQLKAARHGDHRPHVFSAQAVRIHAGDERRPGRRTDRMVRPAERVPATAGGQRVEVRRHRIRIGERTKMRAVIFSRDPEDVGAVGGGRRTGQVRSANK